MSAVRLVWLMGSRGVLIAALAVSVMLLASSPFIQNGFGAPNFDSATYLSCVPFWVWVDFGPRCITFEYHTLYEIPMIPVIIFALGFLFGMKRGHSQWRSRALAGPW